MRIGVDVRPNRPSSTNCHGPTANATKYVGNGRVSPKRTVLSPSPPGTSLSIGVFDNATKSRGTRKVSRHGTLKPGSSKHGNARLADTASNCVIAYDPPLSS